MFNLQGLEKFKKEVSEFEKQKKEELDMLLAFKNEEMKNLKFVVHSNILLVIDFVLNSTGVDDFTESPSQGSN